MKKTSAFNILLLTIVLASVVAWIWEREHAGESAARKRKAPELRVEPPPPLEEPKDPFSETEMAVYRKIMVTYSTGDFAGAVSLAEQSLDASTTSERFRDWLTRQLPVLMTSQGWMKIKTQDCDDASRIFYRVLGMAPVPEAQKGLGFCLRVTKNWPEAASYLAAYILAKPGDAEGRLIYADTLESLGRYDEAVTILEGAVAMESADSESAGFAKDRLAGMRAKAKSGASQKTERSEHFFVSYREEDHEEILRQVLEILEAAMLEYAELLGITPPAAPVEVILYRKEDFYDVVPGGPGWAEGVYDGRMRVPVSRDMIGDVQGRLATVLRHELSHAVLAHRSGGRAWPTWFDEGVAQYLACRKRGCDGFRFSATPGQFSESAILTEPFVRLDPIEAGRAYLHSLYLVRAMVRARGETGLDFISSRTPATGPLTSDFIAEVAGWESFQSMWTEVAAWWKKRESL